MRLHVVCRHVPDCFISLPPHVVKTIVEVLFLFSFLGAHRISIFYSLKSTSLIKLVYSRQMEFLLHWRFHGLIIRLGYLRRRI